MDALLYALVLEVVLLQLRILEGTTELRPRPKPVSKIESAQREKLLKDRETVKDVIRRTLIEIAETGEWRSLQEAVQCLHQRSLSAVNLRLNHERLRTSLENITKELMTKRTQGTQEFRNADRKIALLRDKIKNDLQNAKARINYVEKWLLARAESLELQFQKRRDPLPRSDHENRVHEELLKAYQLQIKEREDAYTYWTNRYVKDTADISQRLTVKCEELRAAEARREDLQSLYNLHEGEMRGWLTFKRERAARLEREERVNTAAKRIQAWWRGMMVRRALGQFRHLRSAKKSGVKGKKK